jgi:hypothetical protein
MKGRYLVVAAAVLCVASGAFASPWESPSGECASFTYENGQNDTDLFGSPSYFSGDTLVFRHASFDADADDANPVDMSADTMDVDLYAKVDAVEGQLKFIGIEILVRGDYNITDPGSTGGNSVTADFDMLGSVAALPGSPAEHPMGPFTGGFEFTESTATGGATSWMDTAELDNPVALSFAVPSVTELHLTVNGSFVAISDGQGGTAGITGSLQLLEVTAIVIPEPASLSLLAFGALALLRRR